MHKLSKIIQKYIERKIAFPPLIKASPRKDLALVVVLPAYKEEHIEPSLKSLINQVIPQEKSIEVIVLINQPSDASQEIDRINRDCLATCVSIQKNNVNPKILIQPVRITFDDKKFGVGLARKVGLDEGIRRLDAVDQVENGLLVFYDADAEAPSDYLLNIDEHFNNYPKTQAASIYFEHVYTDQSDKTQKAITAYELHLRYHTNAMRFAGLPYAFQTIGSSIAVRARSYIEQGGMNKKQAGEDFYFLNKFAAIGCLSEVNSTCNQLSSRLSDRVPFGTGKAMHEIIDKNKEYTTYAFASYKLIKKFIDTIEDLYYCEDLRVIWNRFPDPLKTFLSERNFISEIQKIKQKVKNFEQFRYRFFQWYHPLMNLQLLHHLRDELNPNLKVDRAAKQYLIEVGIQHGFDPMLTIFREMDKQSSWWKKVHK